ncbi:MAG: thiamine pyrophosphate-binding protein [Chloroflexi bacterium]|nr:thiamine pyrophosphate-binding protein [Chloroflexota bacterium]
MAEMKGGRALVETLRNEGVKYVFGIVGSTFLESLDALYGRTDIQYMSVRHEQGAAFMADGYARASDLPGVCLVTSGPAGTNLVTGVGSAYVGHSPVIAIVGGPHSSYLQRDAFQEFDLVNVFKPVTKLSIQVNRPERIPEIMRYAFRTAMMGKKGPVFVEVPRDFLDNATVAYEPQAPESYRVVHRPPADPELVQRAAQLVRRARRPILLVGGGVTASGANGEMVRFAEMLSIPMVTTYGRNDAVPNDHPLYVGPLGRAGAAEAGEACRGADLFLAMGTRLGQFTTFYDDRYIRPGIPVVQLDIDPKEVGRNYPVAVGIVGDAKAVLGQLVLAMKEGALPQPDHAWLREARALREKRLARLEEEGSLSYPPLKPQRVYNELRKALPPETIVTLDAGACPAFGYDRLHFTHPKTFIAPLDLGGLGFAFPIALGAKLGRPDSPVLSINGDGGFLFNVQELETAVRERIGAATIVFNNNEWGSEKAYQKLLYNERYVGADITNPRFDKLAELFGARGYYVEHPDQVGEVVREAVALDVPSIIEIPVDPKELPYPARLAPAKQ